MHDGKFAEEIEVSSLLTTSTVDSALWYFLHSWARAVPFFTFAQDRTRSTEGVCSTSCANNAASLFVNSVWPIYTKRRVIRTKHVSLDAGTEVAQVVTILTYYRGALFESQKMATVLIQAVRGFSRYLQEDLFYNTLKYATIALLHVFTFRYLVSSITVSQLGIFRP
jgi:hypothetical protein